MGARNGSPEEGSSLGSYGRASVIASQASSSSSRSLEEIPMFSGHQQQLQRHFTEHRPRRRIPFKFGIQKVGQTAFASSGKPHCDNGYRKEIFAREGKQGETRDETKAWRCLGDRFASICCKCKRASRVGPQVCFFSFFY